MPLLFLPALAPIALGIGKAIVGGAVASAVGHVAGKAITKTKPGKALGKFWDTHIGRKGLIGEGGEMLGLWESGTTKDNKTKAKNAVYGLMESEESRYEKRQELNAEDLSNSLFANNMKAGGLVGKAMNSGNLATDNSRAQNVNHTIAMSVRNNNATLNRNLQKVLNTEEAHDKTMSSYDSQVQQIEYS